MWPWDDGTERAIKRVRRTVRDHAATDDRRFAELGADFGTKHAANVARFDAQDEKLDRIADAVSPDVLLPAIAEALRTSRRRALLRYAGVAVATLVAIATIVPALPILWGWQVTIVQAVMARQSLPPESPPERSTKTP